MIMIHGVGATNNGEYKEFNTEDPIYKGRKLVLEILRPEKHNPNTEMVCYYFWDNKIKAKIKLTLYRHLNNKTMGSEVYYYKDRQDIKHYYSRNYINFVKIPEKYYDIIKYIEPYFREIYKD